MLALLAEMAFNAAVPLSLAFVIDQAITPHNYTALVENIVGLTLGAMIASGVRLSATQDIDIPIAVSTELTSRVKRDSISPILLGFPERSAVAAPPNYV